MNYDDHSYVIKRLAADQDAEFDIRQRIKDVIDFTMHPQGMWEPSIWDQYNGRPRYTFDLCSPLVKKYWAEMAANEYAATTQPVGGGASEEVSDTIDGLIRNIYRTSSFDDISTKAGKRLISTGSGYWRVVAGYVGEAVYQDLKIVPIVDGHERVWYDCHSTLQTREDARHVTVLTDMPAEEAKSKWSKRDEGFMSLSNKIWDDNYNYKKDDYITVGEIIYKKPIKKMVHLLEDGSEVDDQGLENLGLDVSSAIASREVDTFLVYSRKFDAKGWLEDEKETVFNNLPIVSGYCDFDVNEGKVTYKGIIEPLMDAQRVYNYVESRKVEESILAARSKTWVDERTVEGRQDELSNINRNPAEIQLYNSDVKGAPAAPPIKTPGPQVNPALSELAQGMSQNMQMIAGLPNEIALLEKTGRDSNFRADQRESMGQMGTFECYRSFKVMLEYTAKLLIGAIPRVYDTPRKIRIYDEAGQTSEVDINKMVEGRIINNLCLGKYDVSVKVGATFESRRVEANTKILEAATVIEGLAQRNADIILNNIDAPGMRTAADRERMQLVNNGMIPQDQLTDKEREAQAMAAQQPQQPDPMQIAAQAEATKAQAQAQKAQYEALGKQAELELQKQKQDSEENLKAFEAEMKANKLMLEQQSREIDDLKKLSEILKTLQEAQAAPELIAQQTAITDSAQDQI